MPVSAEKIKALTERMANLGVSENEFAESFIRSSGPGGQKVNKSSTCVHLMHIPTGLSVKCQRERSQGLNRFLARRLLLDKIEAQQKGFAEEKKKLREKIRRQKRKRSKKTKEKILAAKHKRSEIKAMRGKVTDNE
ncbi:MAG TPA: peptide chain release factor-like protein [Smithellaceae bacterium]|jgi:protein subunit release factor B|nr:peptide chain release factor-like protein [Syntrophaceae bacterium]MDX9815862.1 peptide chain release factor-like protein [Smithellaceae bacterium]OPZ51723.1 MAG: Peptide chain release factor 2 [Deltaproteobacteria bacterium ADurb.BinA014]MBP8609404.1 peptide chain release factor-like protein [Syntrophaceae bacterium]HNQ19208.1 peptide chain release factor-like protein [Smithellaceae bacterium]